MIFSGIPFLYYFLPLTLAIYYASPKRLKNASLLVCSLVFYAWGEPKYVFLMGGSIFACYAAGLFVEKHRTEKIGRVCCAAFVAACLLVLGYFKYTDFFLENFNAVTGLRVPLSRVALPIGISFYTFQLISYAVDVYRGEAAQKNIVSMAAYIAMFPQLIAGPIVRYHDVRTQLLDREHTWDTAAEGVRRFVIGLAKKILLANQLGELCGAFHGAQEKSVLFYWLYAVAVALQVYFDFSGYSDMAIGLGKLFGFHLLENFNYPYISASITEFWRRWHISLGMWFRDYVYIPLGGNRAGRMRQLFNILVVWFLTGFWHGAAWNFIAWGLYFAFLLIVEKCGLIGRLKKCRVFAHVYVLLLLLPSFVLFQAQSVREALADIGGLFGAGGAPLVSAEALYCLKSYAVVLAVGVVGATPLARLMFARAAKEPRGEKLLHVMEPAALTLLLLVMTAYLVDGSFNPFLYFRF